MSFRLIALVLLFSSSCILLNEAGLKSPASYAGFEAIERLNEAMRNGWIFGGQVYLHGLSAAPDLRNYRGFQDALLFLYIAIPAVSKLKESSYYDRRQVDSCADHVFWKSALLTWQFLGFMQANYRVFTPLAPENSSSAPGDYEIILSSIYASTAVESCKIEPGGVIIHSGFINI